MLLLIPPKARLAVCTPLPPSFSPLPPAFPRMSIFCVTSPTLFRTPTKPTPPRVTLPSLVPNTSIPSTRADQAEVIRASVGKRSLYFDVVENGRRLLPRLTSRLPLRRRSTRRLLSNRPSTTLSHPRTSMTLYALPDDGRRLYPFLVCE